MANFTEISIEDAKALIQGQSPLIVDVRTSGDYALGHMAGAEHLNDKGLADFSLKADKTRPVLVYCYHGNSSKRMADLLVRNGFSTVYSLIGGYEKWKTS